MKIKDLVCVFLLAFFISLGCGGGSSADPVDARTFVEKLPESVRSSILWFCDYEDRSLAKWQGKGPDDENAGGGIFITDEANTSCATVEDGLTHSGRVACAATIRNATTPGEPKAVRLMRWTNKPWYDDGDLFPQEAYYSTFLLFRYAYDPAKDPDNDPNKDGGWWNLLQFKSKNNAGSHPLVKLDLYNKNNKMHFGLVVKDYKDDNSSSYTQSYCVQSKPLAIPVNQWTHIEVYYKKSKSYDGKVIVWQNGVKIFEKDGIRTVLPPDETAVFGIGNYTDYITGGPAPGEATVYFDDAIVSSQRISAHLK